MLTVSSLPTSTPLRDTITKAYRMDETECLAALLPLAQFPAGKITQIIEKASKLVINTREYKKKQSKIDALLHQYDLSTDEGIALMCLAEALLRIPDKATMDRFISDKLSSVDWKNSMGGEQSFFSNAATW